MLHLFLVYGIWLLEEQERNLDRTPDIDAFTKLALLWLGSDQSP